MRLVSKQAKAPDNTILSENTLHYTYYLHVVANANRANLHEVCSYR